MNVPVPASGPPRWRVAVVEDHLLQRTRTEEIIGLQPGMGVVCSVESLEEFTAWLATCRPAERPHLLMLDLQVDRGNDADPAVVAQVVASGVRVLVFSAMASRPLVRAMLQSGVAGIVGKRDPESEVVSAMWSVLGQRRWMSTELAAVIAGDDQRPQLSEQEERALILYASGLTLDAVADRLGVGRESAKTYLDRVRRKYSEVGRPVRSKVDMSRAALADGFLDLDGAPDPADP